MKYIVTVAGREIEVEIAGDQVRVGGRSLSAALRRVPGTPLRYLLVDGRPSTLVIEGNGRGQWTIGARGERWDVEAVDMTEWWQESRVSVRAGLRMRLSAGQL